MTAQGAELEARPGAGGDVASEIRTSRRHPRPTQFDYLHLRYLVRDLATALRSVDGRVERVLDLYCGTRPYEDLLPAGARCVGLDIEDTFGVADVVTDEFLPFADESFDLVLCTEAFHYVPDPVYGVAEIRRVLRPGGKVVLTVPLVWEYDRTILEHRYTGPELARLFAGWDDVQVVENGGRAVSWTTLTGSIVRAAEKRALERLRPPRLVSSGFRLAYLLVNGVGLLLDRSERKHASGRFTLPMNLLVTARRPADA